jgi:cytochrome P450
LRRWPAIGHLLFEGCDVITKPDPAEIRPEARLLDRVRREGPVLSLPGGVVGIFSPALATKVDKANTEELKMAESLVDYFKLRKNSNPVAWREIRALLTEQSGKLATPEHMKALHGRMHEFLSAQVGQKQDLTKLIWRTASRALIPLVLDDLDEDGLRKVIVEQEMRFRIQQEQKVSFRQRISDFLLLRAATRVVTRRLERRIRNKEPHDDFAQSLLTLADRIGVDRVTYLVTVQFIAISGVPGMMAACLLYGMARYPEWRERIRSEMAGLDPDELYSLPVRKLPCTLRFIKEAMRLWTTPFVTRRVAARDIELDEVAVKKGETYELSSYIQHHSEQYWDDPEVFDPDRWLASRKPEAKGAYVPFGFAPRSCVGASVGHAQLILFCALVTRDFDFEVSPGHDPWMRMDGFAVPNDFVGSVSAVDPVSKQATR